MKFNLNCKEYGDNLVGSRVMRDGVGHAFKFQNGYGASVIKHKFSNGYSEDLWELAVLKFDGSGGYDLVYDTAFTDDIVGYLTDEEVYDLFRRIEKLDENGNEKT